MPPDWLRKGGISGRWDMEKDFLVFWEKRFLTHLGKVREAAEVSSQPFWGSIGQQSLLAHMGGELLDYEMRG